MLNQGIGLMFTGMGTVFSFLVILWFSVWLMGITVKKLNEIYPEPIKEVKSAVKKLTDDTEIAISVAMAKIHG